MASTKTLGPWPKGLNLTRNRGSSIFLQSDELGEADNVTFTPEGFIEPRPGYKKYLFDFTTTGPSYVIGQIELPNGSTVVFVQGTGAIPRLWMVVDKTTITEVIWTDKVPGVIFTHVMSYQSIDPNHTGVFVFSKYPNRSIRNPTLDLSGAWAPMESSLNVPGSDTGFIVKDRLFLFNYDKSTMYWSPANYILDFAKRDAANYGTDTYAIEPIEPTNASDGIRTVQFTNNNFYIFKKTKSYMFTYQSDPATDGYLRKLSENVGALDSVLFQNSVVLVNNRGVFRIEGTEFIDIQQQLDLRFEIPIDHANISITDVFISVYNDNILVGFRDILTDSANPKSYYYLLNGKTGAWSRWSFDYTSNIAAPGSKHYKAQSTNTTKTILLTHDFTKKHLIYTDYKPGNTIPEYHMDSDTTNSLAHDLYYIPPVGIKTAASFGNPIRYSKLYRTYIRFYMSDIPAELLPPDTQLWTLSINYNSYKFSSDTNVDGNPIFILHPSNAEFAEQTLLEDSGADGKMAVYQRTYQIPIPQQRIKEFVVELKRAYNSITPAALSGLVNPDVDKPIKNGYYFMVSAIWIDYQDKAGI